MRSLYDWFMMPLEHYWLHRIRQQIMLKASGHVLEIGVGTGVNYKYFDFKAFKSYTTIDLVPLAMDLALKKSNICHEHVEGSVENIPFEEGTFDTVIESLVLCSVPHMDKAISELMRVLKPGGRLIFIDHVLPERPTMRRIFMWADKIWPHFASGCHLTREPHLIISSYGGKWITDGRNGKSIFKFGVFEKSEWL